MVKDTERLAKLESKIDSLAEMNKQFNEMNNQFIELRLDSIDKSIQIGLQKMSDEYNSLAITATAFKTASEERFLALESRVKAVEKFYMDERITKKFVAKSLAVTVAVMTLIYQVFSIVIHFFTK